MEEVLEISLGIPFRYGFYDNRYIGVVPQEQSDEERSPATAECEAICESYFGKRFYLLIILELKTRKIVQYHLTENPCREFVKQRIELFSEDFPEKKTLIYDNAPQFASIDYSWYDIKGVHISTAAPNMNAFTERVIGSIRREALDHFLLFSQKQVQNIIQEHIYYYNYLRPHQSLKGIPEGNIYRTSGNIKKEQILGGLHHNYYLSSA